MYVCIRYYVYDIIIFSSAHISGDLLLIGRYRSLPSLISRGIPSSSVVKWPLVSSITYISSLYTLYFIHQFYEYLSYLLFERFGLHTFSFYLICTNDFYLYLSSSSRYIYIDMLNCFLLYIKVYFLLVCYDIYFVFVLRYISYNNFMTSEWKHIAINIFIA